MRSVQPCKASLTKCIRQFPARQKEVFRFAEVAQISMAHATVHSSDDGATQWQSGAQFSLSSRMSGLISVGGVHVESASKSRDHLIRMGFLDPSWVNVANGGRPRRDDDWEDVPGGPSRGGNTRQFQLSRTGW